MTGSVSSVPRMLQNLLAFEKKSVVHLLCFPLCFSILYDQTCIMAIDETRLSEEDPP